METDLSNTPPRLILWPFFASFVQKKYDEKNKKMKSTMKQKYLSAEIDIIYCPIIIVLHHFRYIMIPCTDWDLIYLFIHNMIEKYVKVHISIKLHMHFCLLHVIAHSGWFDLIHFPMISNNILRQGKMHFMRILR